MAMSSKGPWVKLPGHVCACPQPPTCAQARPPRRAGALA